MTGGGSSSSQLQQRISTTSFLGHGLDSTSTVQNGLGVPLYFTDNPPPSVVPVTSSPARTTYRPSVDLSNTSTMMPTRLSSYSSPPRYNPPAPIYHPPTSSTTRLSTSSLPSRSLPLPMPSVSTHIRNSPSRYDHEQHVQSTQAITSTPPQKTTSSQSQSQLPPPLHFTNTSPDRLHTSRSHTTMGNTATSSSSSSSSSSSLLSASRRAPAGTESSSAVFSDPLVVGLSRLREHLREIEDNAPSLLDQSVLRQGEPGRSGSTQPYSSSSSSGSMTGRYVGGNDNGNIGIDPRRSIGASSSILLGLPTMRSPSSSTGNSPARNGTGTETTTTAMGGEIHTDRMNDVRRSISTIAPTSMPLEKEVRFDTHISASGNKAYRYDDGADLTAEDISLFDLAK